MKHLIPTFNIVGIMLVLAFSCSLSAQISDRSYYHSSPLDNMLLPSPEPASLIRYVDCPVSYCTGVANYDVPIYSCKGRELSLDICLITPVATKPKVPPESSDETGIYVPVG